MMITCLLFTLAQRQAPAEGRAFPGKALTPKAGASKLALIPSSGDIPPNEGQKFVHENTPAGRVKLTTAV